MFLALVLFLHLTQDGQLELEAGFVPPTVQGSALLAVGTQRAVLVGIQRGENSHSGCSMESCACLQIPVLMQHCNLTQSLIFFFPE